MCEESATAEDIRAATPHPVPGSAVDPITLKPVDEVVVTTLVDNVYDGLLAGQEKITRAPIAAGIAQAPQFESRSTQVGLIAEHGFSALVSVRTGSLAMPGASAQELPTLSKRALTSEGFDVIERRQPSLLLNGSVLITGEVDRTTDFERGMPRLR